MEKKRNLAPESSQLVEPPLKQHESEEEQENDQAFEQSSTSPFGHTNSAFGCSMRRSSSTPAFGSSSTSFGAFEQSPTCRFLPNSLFGDAFGSSMRRSSSTPAFGSSSTSFGAFEQSSACHFLPNSLYGDAFGSSLRRSSTSFGAFEQSSACHFLPNSLFGDAFGCSLRRSSSTPAFGSSSTSFGAFEQSPTCRFLPNSLFGDAFRSSMRRSSSAPNFGSSSTSFGGLSGFGQKPFGSTMPTSNRKHLEAVWKLMELETIAEQPAFEPYTPLSIISHPAITEEDGGTSGQTAKLESISAIPAYNYERYESCFAIAGADYCVIAADFTGGHTKISELSKKCVMASCGFQADVKALQEALSAENLRYECEHKKPMSCPEMRTLFCDFEKCHPKYVFIVLGGLDSKGKGRVFQHFGPGATIASGVGRCGSKLIIPPILKCKLPVEDDLSRLSETEAVDLAKTVFASATNTGDELEIFVLNANGLRRDHVYLRNNSAVVESSSM